MAELIDRHQKITMYCGAGVREAHAEVLELAGRLKAPVGYTLRGKQWIEHDNPYAVGLTGLFGFGGCTKALEDADLLLLVGTDFPYRQFIPEKSTIVQIDASARAPRATVETGLRVVGDAARTLHLGASQKLHGEARRKLDIYVRHTGGQSPVHREFVAATLDRLAAEDAIFVSDTGMATVWACRYLSMSAGRRLIGSFNHGSMANAMPQAIGAQLAFPGRQVVAMCGDGGLTMLLGDLSTITTYDLPIKLIVFDNSLLDMVHWEMLAEGVEPHETDLKNPDFAEFAEAYGILGIGVDRHDDVPGAVSQAFAHSGPPWCRSAPPGWRPGSPSTRPGNRTRASPRRRRNSSGTVTPIRWSTWSWRVSATSASSPACPHHESARSAAAEPRPTQRNARRLALKSLTMSGAPSGTADSDRMPRLPGRRRAQGTGRTHKR